MDEFFEEVQGESRSAATKLNYSRRGAAFEVWMKSNHPASCNETGVFCLERVTTQQICEFIAKSSMKDGKLLSYSTPESNHSAILNMYRSLKIRCPEDFNQEWLEYSKGFRNKVAENISLGTQATAGSDKLTFEQYRILSTLAVKSSTFYAHGFLTLAWNLMSRAGSTGNIKFSHLRWDNDHLIVVIPKHKGDRSGKKLPTEKSLYANPIYPEICPFLVLGIILLSRQNNGKIESILLGAKSEENINNWLKKTLSPDDNDTINRHHLTSHCTRKGKKNDKICIQCSLILKIILD